MMRTCDGCRYNQNNGFINVAKCFACWGNPDKPNWESKEAKLTAK